ncbi:hypothetical protein F2P79_024703 [Pimephales promelas]|nr:hypothetical protein F2P79_024703 [Pimephales promelas]
MSIVLVALRFERPFSVSKGTHLFTTGSLHEIYPAADPQHHQFQNPSARTGKSNAAPHFRFWRWGSETGVLKLASGETGGAAGLRNRKCPTARSRIRNPKWRPRATSIEAISGDAPLMIDCVATVISFLQISSFSDAPPPPVKLLPLQFTNKRWNIPLSYK